MHEIEATFDGKHHRQESSFFIQWLLTRLDVSRWHFQSKKERQWKNG